MRFRLIAALVLALPLAGAACEGGTTLQGDGTVDAADVGVEDAGVEEFGGEDAGAEDDGEARDDGEGPEDVVSPPDAVLPPTCGDGELDPGEECDDGDRWNGDDCDWLCRTGAGAFDYPPVDESVPPVDPRGVAVEVLAADELTAQVTRVELVARGSEYGLLYVLGEPEAATKLRVLDAGGHPIAEPWERTELGVAPPSRLSATSDGFALFDIPADRSPLVVTFFDADAHQLGDPVVILRLSETAASWQLLHVAPTSDGFVVDTMVADPDPRTMLAAVSPSGVPLGPTTSFSLPVACSFGHPMIASLGDGVACSASDGVVALDRTLIVVGWSGFLHGRRATFYGAANADLTDGLLRFDLLDGAADPTAPVPEDLVATSIGLGGEVTMPPRVVQPGARPGMSPLGAGIEADAGACGVLVAWDWTDLDGDPPVESGIRLFNTDRAGHPRSAPVELVPSDVWSFLPNLFDLAAGATGGGIVYFVDVFAPRLVFRPLTCGAG